MEGWIAHLTAVDRTSRWAAALAASHATGASARRFLDHLAEQAQRWNQNGFRCFFSPAISFIDTASKMRPPTIT